MDDKQVPTRVEIESDDELLDGDSIDERDDSGGTIRYTIMSYGADLPVDTLVMRLDNEEIFVPDFQREFIWTLPQASRFIESLLLGLPVPGVFFFKDPETEKLMVVDGQQRLRTLQAFRHGSFGEKRFRLVRVSPEFDSKTYDDLMHNDRLRLDHSIIHATVFHQGEPNDDRSSIYSVFERLNTGGSPLHPQEIRASVFRGQFNDLLSELSDNHHWKQLYGSNSKRKKNEELILRFLALHQSLPQYDPPMKKFLTDFMEMNRKPDADKLAEYRRCFEGTVEVVAEKLGRDVLRPERALNVSVADAIFVGLASRLQRGDVTDDEALRDATQKILAALREGDLYKVGTTNKERVMKRIDIAKTEYGGVD